MMAAEELARKTRLDVTGNVKDLKFLHDRLNRALPSNTKDVRTLITGIGSRSISLYSVLPDGTSLMIATIEISMLRQCIPADHLGRGTFFSGLLGRFSSPPSDLRIYPALTGTDREGLLISGCIDGDVSFWYWNPWDRHGIFSASEEDDDNCDETGTVEFLCRGPTELDKIASASLVQLQNEKSSGLSLLIASPLGSVYSLPLNKVPCTTQWTCHESSEDPISDVRIDRYDHETISIALIRQDTLSLLMYGPNGLIDLGSIRVSGSTIKLAFWREDQFCCLVEEELVGVSVANGQTERISSHRLPNYPIWTLYSDEALEADAIICGLGFGVVEFFSVRSASLVSLLRAEHSLPQGHVTDLMMEPSMQVKVLLTLEDKSHAIFTLPELMKLQSWTDTAVRYPMKMEFARWFDLMAPFPYAPGREHARLCIDELLGKDLAALYPPRSWSDLGRLVESLPAEDTRSFLYLLLDAKQDPARISSFCRRYSVDGYHLHLIRALHSFDLGAPAEALHHLVLALRSETILLDGQLSLILPKVVPSALRNEPTLLILAYRLVGGTNRVALSEEAVLDAYIKLGKYSQALQFARDQDLVAQLITKLSPSRVSKLILTEEEQGHLSPHSQALYQLARGNTSGAFGAFEAWRSSGVPLDDPALVKVMPSMQQFKSVLPKSLVDKPKPARTKSTAPRIAHEASPTKKTPICTPTSVSPMKPVTPTAVVTPKIIEPNPTVVPVTPPAKLSLRSSPGPSAASSPTSSPSAAGSSPKTGGSTSSPPLRSVLPRHVPANQPSRLANLVESSGDDDDMVMSGEMVLEANVFTRALLDDMEEVEPSSSEEYETVDEMIESEVASSSPAKKSSPKKSSPTKGKSPKKCSPKKSPKNGESPVKMSPTKSLKKSPKKDKSPLSPAKEDKSPVSPAKSPKKSSPPKTEPRATKPLSTSPSRSTRSSPSKTSSPTKSASPSKSTTSTSASTTTRTSEGSPRRYNLRQLPPVDYPDSAPSPRRHHRTHSPAFSKPKEEEPKYVLSTPTMLKVKAAETKSQFRKRIREDLALPSPIVKRTRKAPGSDEAYEMTQASVSASPRRKSPAKTRSPKSSALPATPTRTSTRSRSKLATPSINRTTEDAATATPPVRATPPAALRRGRR